MEELVLNASKDVAKPLRAKGLVFHKGLLPERSTEEVARIFGEPIIFGSNPPVHELRPKSTGEAAQNTYSGQYGLGGFPLHTDMANWHRPPRYLMLRCVVGSADVATTLLDPRFIIEAIGVENLSRALMKPRRRVAGRISLLPLALPHEDGTMFRWDERYIEPASRVGELCAAEIRRQLHDAPMDFVYLTEPGDTVLIDNWRMLHGRTAVPIHDRSRCIERVYLGTLN